MADTTLFSQSPSGLLGPVKRGHPGLHEPGGGERMIPWESKATWGVRQPQEEGGGTLAVRGKLISVEDSMAVPQKLNTEGSLAGSVGIACDS